MNSVTQPRNANLTNWANSQYIPYSGNSSFRVLKLSIIKEHITASWRQGHPGPAIFLYGGTRGKLPVLQFFMARWREVISAPLRHLTARGIYEQTPQ